MQTISNTPRGMRDFGPAVLVKRQFILDTIRKVFERYGFLPLETPAMEYLSTLLGKYGSEGDELLFKVLNSGNFLDEVNLADTPAMDAKRLTGIIANKGLRYDLTVPFARYVAANRHTLTLPFKRFQTQPVWRADRPQRGRYREFLQCDADVIGTQSLLCEAEMMGMICDIMESLGIVQYRIKINHRSILSALAKLGGASDEGSFFSVLDKWDKVGGDEVKRQWVQQGIQVAPLERIFFFFDDFRTFWDQLNFFQQEIPNSPAMEKGLEDFKAFYQFLKSLKIPETHLEMDIKLARGLSYYTGLIFEVTVDNSGVGSIVGGGRYDNLTGIFGLPDVSGVGLSFGIDRLYDTMEKLALFPDTTTSRPTTLIAHMDEVSMHYGAGVISTLRQHGYCATLYPEVCKVKKQIAYADKCSIPFVIIIGEEEMKSGKLTFKHMATHQQTQMTLDEIMGVIAQQKP